MATTDLRAALAAGQPVFGTFVLEFNTPGVGALLARAGADWILYDLEHTGWSVDAIRAPLAVSRREDIASFVRIIGTAQHLVSGALDAGAEGIMVPYVNTAEQAQQLVSWLKYPPLGVRGSAFGVAHDLYTPGDPATKARAANESTVFLPQIETPQAVAHAREIAGVAGVDVLFVGPLDLSTNLGAPGNFSTPEFDQALQEVARAAQDHGKACGIFSPSDELTQRCLELGFQVISHSADVSVFQRALATQFDRMRGWAQ